MSSSFSKPNSPVTEFHGMITRSKKMMAFFELLQRLSRTDSAVLIRGQSGTGKELAARAIHKLSPRSSMPFNAVNCAMLSQELATSELFGHAKGSFTGAHSDHQGYFQASNKGTLFLDEIAELPMTVQGRLLRAIQEKSVSPLGSTKSANIDVRIVSATHKSLRQEVKALTFREDLMYRIRVVPIFLPTLSERDGDIEVLSWRFIDEFNKLGGRHISEITQDAREALLSYSWPGNIRELRNNIEFAFAIGDGPALNLEDLTPELRGEGPPGAETWQSIDHRRQEKQEILQALNKAKGKKGDAAAALNMSRSTFWRKLKEHGLS